MTARFNAAACADYYRLGYVLGNRDLLHAQFPPSSQATRGFDDAIRTVDRVAKSSVFVNGDSLIQRTVDSLVAAIDSLPRTGLAISMSGGWDSRVLLALCLATGRRPRLILSGVPGSFDTTMVHEAGVRWSLEVQHVCVTADTLLARAPHIAHASRGLMNIANWAGLAHLVDRQVSLDGEPVLLGMNGEYARSYYGVPPFGGGAPAIKAAVAELARRFVCPFSDAELEMMSPELCDALRPGSFHQRCSESLMAVQASDAAQLLDEFYLRNYARNKTGCEQHVLVSQKVNPVLPFLDANWLSCVRAMTRAWKVDDLHHREMVRLLRPELLNWPGEYEWLAAHPDAPQHFLDQTVFRSESLVRALANCKTVLQGLVDASLIDRLSEELSAGTARPFAAFGLLATAEWLLSS